MNGKIPVGTTIGAAYRFAFMRFFAVLGVVWLPLLLAIAAGYLLFRSVEVPSLAPADAREAVMNWTRLYMSILGPLYALQLVLWVSAIMIEVGLTRLALGIGRPPMVFFTLGPAFWRMLGANLILAVILMLVMVPVFLVVFGFAAAMGALAQNPSAARDLVDPSAAPWIVAVMAVLFLAGFIGIYYVYLRLWFFLAPVVIAEAHIDLRPGWRLAKGNVLRILVILLAVTIPPIMLLFVAEGMALYMVLSRDWTSLPDAQFFIDRWPQFTAIAAVALLGWILATAAMYGARAAAYRALVPAEPSPDD
jgi:hypothetical protein